MPLVIGSSSSRRSSSRNKCGSRRNPSPSRSGASGSSCSVSSSRQSGGSSGSHSNSCSRRSKQPTATTSTAAATTATRTMAVVCAVGVGGACVATRGGRCRRLPHHRTAWALPTGLALPLISPLCSASLQLRRQQGMEVQEEGTRSSDRRVHSIPHSRPCCRRNSMGWVLSTRCSFQTASGPQWLQEEWEQLGQGQEEGGSLCPQS
mmetsp:Transcript_17195/g.47698  ORF Transcript_17195/g.47698 Transcript_17195/m.47698 type:complete len:206 (+) Transcript_17195:456-1073(+)